MRGQKLAQTGQENALLQHSTKTMDDLKGFVRPPGAAARMAAMRERFNSSPKAGPTNSKMPYNMATLDNLSVAIQKWLEGLDGLSDPVVSRRKLGDDEEQEPSEKRVHKVTVPADRDPSIKDIVMDDAPPSNYDIMPDSIKERAKEMASRERAKVPLVSSNLANRCITRSMTVGLNNIQASAAPLSPPAGRFEHLEIQTPGMEATKKTVAIPLPTPPMDTMDQPLDQQHGHTHESTSSPTSTDLLNNQSSRRDTSKDIASMASVTNILQAEVLTDPSTATNTILQSSTPTSTNKKLKLESISATNIISNNENNKPTILDALLAKRSKNPVYYDGTTQNLFHTLVLELSQQIQSVKKERRLVMFAKDKTCMKLLEKQDTILQDALKTVENASFMWLRGRPDWKEMNGLKEKLAGVEESVKEFKESGWTLTASDDDDNDSESDAEGTREGKGNEDTDEEKIDEAILKITRRTMPRP